jgi:hypothetical protein
MEILKNLRGDLRNWFVNHVMDAIVVGLIAVFGTVVKAISNSMKSQPIPWTVLLVIAAIGLLLAGLAIVTWIRNKKNNGLVQPARLQLDEHERQIRELNENIARRTLRVALQRLRIACDPHIEGCVRRVSWGKDVWANFLRVKVESGSSASIKNCAGFLIRIEKDGRTKWGGENAQLTFAHGKDPDAFAKTIRSKMSEFLDVLVVSSKNEIFTATKDHSWRYRPLIPEIFSEPGDYLLTVKITGDGVPTVTAPLRFTWTQNWKTAVLTLITADDKKDEVASISNEARSSESQLLPPKRQTLVIIDCFNELINKGEVMLAKFREQRLPFPTEQEVKTLGDELIKFCETCATAGEREKLKNSLYELTATDSVTNCYFAKESMRICQELCGKIKVACQIRDRIHREDKA